MLLCGLLEIGLPEYAEKLSVMAARRADRKSGTIFSSFVDQSTSVYIKNFGETLYSLQCPYSAFSFDDSLLNCEDICDEVTKSRNCNL